MRARASHMTFKAQPHRYIAGISPTSRARCRGCRQLIAKGEVRLVVHAFVRPNRGTRFMRHISCISKLEADIVRAHGSVDDVPLDDGTQPDEAARVRALMSILVKP